VIRALALAALVAVVRAGAAAAQPAPPPPAGYPGPVYVDGQGCAFQRAEIGESVLWAARLAADGAPRCGLTPSAGVSGSDAVTAIPPHRRGQAPAFPEPGRYVQIAAFRDTVRADALVTRLMLRGLPVLRQDFGGGGLRVILAGPLGDARAAAATLAELRAMGHADAFLRVAE